MKWPAQHSLRGADRSVGMRCRQRVGVATDQLPSVALQTKSGRDAQIEGRPLVATADLGLPMLVLEQRDEICANVTGNFFTPNWLAIAEVR